MQRIAPASAIASEPVSDSLEFDELFDIDMGGARSVGPARHAPEHSIY